MIKQLGYLCFLIGVSYGACADNITFKESENLTDSYIQGGSAQGLVNSSSAESSIKNSYIPNDRKQPRAKVLTEYTGIVGTGIKYNTVSSTGAAVEFTPSGSNYYTFFSQTLASGIYYEGRLYARNNYTAQNPVFPSVPVSNEDNPMGYGAVIKVGYDFHPTNLIDIVPYLRFNAYNNMSVVYSDTNGDNINSTTYAILPGVKVGYKVTPQFNPYVELYGGWQKVNISGDFPQSGTPGSSSGSLNQTTLTYEIGFSSKLTKNLSLIPYMQYVTTQNSPDSTAAAPYKDNGFNISSLTSTQQVYGLKLAVAW